MVETSNAIEFIPNWKLRERLADAFPAAIARKGKPKKPLSVTVRRDLLLAMPDLTETHVRRWLSWYTGKITYLKALQEPDAMRVDLAGNPVQPVAEPHKQHAARRMARQIKRKEAFMARRSEREEIAHV
jgi:sRNA-binding protein